MNTSSTPATKRLALGLVVALAAVVYATPEPTQHWRSLVALCDYGHVVAFGFTTFALYFVADEAFRKRYGELSTIALAASGALAMGAFVEYLQASTGGNGELGDVWRDAGGAFSAAALLVAGKVAMATWCRRACRGVAAMTLLWFLLPTAYAAYDELVALAEFPVLVSFADRRELRRFEALPDGAHIVQKRSSDGVEQSALAMRWQVEKYPGFEFAHFPGDWRAWRALALNLVNLSAVPVTINVRLDDADYRYDLDAADRYDGRFVLDPGLNKVEIPLDVVARAPQHRTFDLGRVRLILVQGVELKVPCDLLLNEIRLVH